MSTYLPTYLPTYLSVYLSINLSIFLSDFFSLSELYAQSIASNEVSYYVISYITHGKITTVTMTIIIIIIIIIYEQLPRYLDDKLVDNEQSYAWLKFEDIKGETESIIVAAQDQTISTNYFKNNILKEDDSKCRLCKHHEETIDYLTSGCPILAKN